MKIAPKQVELAAYRWDGSTEDTKLIQDKEPTLKTDYIFNNQNHVYCWTIRTSSGSQEVRIGDVIIKLADSCFQICSYEIFRKLFEIKET